MVRYRIRGTSWSQDPLVYRELLEAKAILKGHFSGFAGNEQALGELIDRLAEDKVLPRLMKVLLKPNARTAVGRFMNRRRMAKTGITPENVCDFMTAPLIAKVLLDFFVLNVSWILSLMDSATRSTTSVAQAALTAEGARSRLQKLSLTLRGAIFSSPTTTADSPQR